jgi:hypothetical protein
MMHILKPQAVEPMADESHEWFEMMDREWTTMSTDLRLMCWFEYLDHIESGQPRISDYRFILRPLYNRLAGLGVVGAVLSRCNAFMSMRLANVGGSP